MPSAAVHDSMTVAESRVFAFLVRHLSIFSSKLDAPTALDAAVIITIAPRAAPPTSFIVLFIPNHLTQKEMGQTIDDER